MIICKDRIWKLNKKIIFKILIIIKLISVIIKNKMINILLKKT